MKNYMKIITPKIYLECNLIFDNDISMNEITKEVGFVPTSFKDKKDQRKSPFKDDKLEAFWSIATNKIETFYLEEVTKEMTKIIKPYLERIKATVMKYNGVVDFLVVPDFHSTEAPALNFNREFLEIINYLNATVQIDMYID